jgi:hypothetical protein
MGHGRVCTNFGLAAMLVAGGVRAIKVHVRATNKSTILVVSGKELGGQLLPGRRHMLLKVLRRQFAHLAYGLFPVMEQCIVEW